jgi:hypothetical protein
MDTLFHRIRQAIRRVAEGWRVETLACKPAGNSHFQAAGNSKSGKNIKTAHTKINNDMVVEKPEKSVTIWPPVKRPQSRHIFSLPVVFTGMLSSDCSSHLFELFAHRRPTILSLGGRRPRLPRRFSGFRKIFMRIVISYRAAELKARGQHFSRPILYNLLILQENRLMRRNPIGGNSFCRSWPGAVVPWECVAMLQSSGVFAGFSPGGCLCKKAIPYFY